jgi:hypothetical protein
LSADAPGPSLRAGRKLGLEPEIAGKISHNAW